MVEDQYRSGLLWPDVLIQLNPSFKAGASIDELVESDVLHPQCSQVFRVGKTEEAAGGNPLRLHKHQEEAIHAASQDANYVLTTGTGSGKSLAYIIPIVNEVLKQGSGKGIRAIIVYPMNALANSQAGELDKFLKLGFDTPPVTYRRYTGQESDDEKREIQERPPDIILTNYVMLELILTRPREHRMISAAENLRFVVLDELHTYRGRQGADVAMLLRRLRNIVGRDDLLCIGTSATMGSGDNILSQRQEVSEVASLLFGSPVSPNHVIGETLEPMWNPIVLQTGAIG